MVINIKFIVKHYIWYSIIAVNTLGLAIFLTIVLLAHASLHDLAIAALMVIIISSIIGGIGGWLLQKFFFSLLEYNAKPPVAKNIELNTRQPIKVKYELDRNDILAFAVYDFENSPRIGKFRKRVRLMLPFACLLEIILALVVIIVWGEKLLAAAIFIGIAAITTLLYYFFSPVLIRKRARRAIEKSSNPVINKLLGKHYISIKAEGISDTTETGESITPWNTVLYFLSTDQYLFLVVRGSLPFIIPGRAFAGETEFKQFIEIVKAYYQ